MRNFDTRRILISYYIFAPACAHINARERSKQMCNCRSSAPLPKLDFLLSVTFHLFPQHSLFLPVRTVAQLFFQLDMFPIEKQSRSHFCSHPTKRLFIMRIDFIGRFMHDLEKELWNLFGSPAFEIVQICNHLLKLRIYAIFFQSLVHYRLQLI